MGQRIKIPLRCQHCGGSFMGAASRKFCSCHCANSAHRPVTLKPKTCPVCAKTFQPRSHRSKTCSRACGGQLGMRSMRMQALAQGREIGRSLYVKRLAAKLMQMTKGEIWREAYVRGYNACRQRMRRGVAA
jgi:hypothetical protein